MQLVLEGQQTNTQCICLLDVGLHVQQHARSFARVEMAPRALVQYPLVSSEAIAHELSAVLATLPQHMSTQADQLQA